MSELLVYRRFNDPALAQNLADILNEQGIRYVLEENASIFNPTFATQTEASREYSLKIYGEDFTKANKIIADYESKFTDNVESDYYLFDFTDDELMEIVAKPDEWSPFDLALAKKLLNERGITIDRAAEEKFAQVRLNELKTPEKSETLWIVIGYFFALGGGVLGFFIGWQLWTGKKILPNGEQVYTHSYSDRKNGKQIFYLSILGLLALIIKNLHFITG